MLGWAIRIVIVILIVRALWRFVSGVVEGAVREHRPKSSVPLVRDPVCGTYVVPARALSLTSAGGIRYFCSDKCRSAYRDRT